MACEVFPSGDRLFTFGLETFATLWSTSTGMPMCRLHGHRAAIHAGTLFPAGDMALTGSIDMTAIIWDADACKMSQQLVHDDWVMGVAVLGNGRTVATIMSEVATIWRVADGKLLRRLSDGRSWHPEFVYAFEPFPWDDLLATFNSGEALRRPRASSISTLGVDGGQWGCRGPVQTGSPGAGPMSLVNRASGRLSVPGPGFGGGV